MIIGLKKKILTVFLTLTMICVAGSAYSTKNDSNEVTSVYPQDGSELIQDISSRYGNDNDIWLDEEQIEPDQYLIGHELNLQVNIYYDMPVIDLGTDNQSSALGDLFELKLIVSLVDNNSKELVELVNEPVRLEDLNTNPKGIEKFNIKVPWEMFADHIKRWEDGNNDTKNFMKVEIMDVPDGTNLSDFEKSEDNNAVIVELYAISVPTICLGGFGGRVLDSSIVTILFFLLILVIFLLYISKNKPGTSNEEEPPYIHNRKNPSTNDVNTRMEYRLRMNRKG